MSFVEEECGLCLELLGWSTGHSSASMKEPIGKLFAHIRRHLRSSPPDLTGMTEALEALERMVGELVDSRPSPFSLERVSVASLLENRLASMWRRRPPYTMAQFTLELGEAATDVSANPVWLQRAIDALVDNAIDAVAESSRREIHLSAAADGTAVRIAVRDTGCGIDNREDLFRKPENLRRGGRGRGLYIARLSVELLGGEIQEEDIDRAGTTMVLKLPRWESRCSELEGW